jgi:hypothetical protein
VAKYGAFVEPYAASDGLGQLLNSRQLFIVIVDAWALKLEGVSQMLSDLDRYRAETWSYILVFDEEQDTHESRDELRAASHKVLRNTSNTGSRKIKEVHSDPEFAPALDSAMTALRLELISRARPEWPDQPPLGLPILPTVERP